MAKTITACMKVEIIKAQVHVVFGLYIFLRLGPAGFAGGTSPSLL